MTISRLPFDVTRGKHQGNAYSIAANSRCQKEPVREVILKEIIRAGAHGWTCREVAERLHRGMHTVSPRISELKILGLVRGAGRSRDGCEVLVAAQPDHLFPDDEPPCLWRDPEEG